MLKKMLWLTAALLSFAIGAADLPNKPNRIFIPADDRGYGDLCCYGQKVIQTPRLDKMAAESMRFTQHYAGSTVCGPSRSCLLTGLHSGHTYLRGNGKLAIRRDPQDIIIARTLKDAGYHTAMIGKSGLACNDQDGKLPNDKGFDHFFGFTSHTDAHWYYPPYLYKNGAKVKYPKNKLHEGDNYSSDLVMDDALRYVEEQKDGPFFLHLAFQIPHASLRAKEEWKAKYRKILNEKLLPERKKHPHYSYEREPKTTFAAMVSCMDDNVGRLLDKLKELGIDKNTLVLFASDNGAMNEGGHKRASFNSSGVLRGGKRDLYEGGIRTPFIAWWPGVVEAGQVSDHISAFWDFAPTACELAGIKNPQPTDGISYVPTLTGKKQQAHKYLYWEFHEQSGKRAVRQGKWKAVMLKTGKLVNPPVELYDLSKDISEKNNIAGKYPEVVSEMKKLFDEAHTPSKIFKLASEKK